MCAAFAAANCLRVSASSDAASFRSGSDPWHHFAASCASQLNFQFSVINLFFLFFASTVHVENCHFVCFPRRQYQLVYRYVCRRSSIRSRKRWSWKPTTKRQGSRFFRDKFIYEVFSKGSPKCIQSNDTWATLGAAIVYRSTEGKRQISDGIT